MCTKPLLKIQTNILNKDKTAYELHWLPKSAYILPLDEIHKRYGNDLIEIPCGKCQECLNNKKRELATRAYFTFKDKKDTYFLTLTFEDLKESLKAEKNPKKYLKENLKIDLKDYLASFEHGETTGRGHYHLITELTKEEAFKINLACKKGTKNNYWSKGFTCIEEATPETIFYTANYTLKKENSTDIIFFNKGLGKKEALENIENLKKFQSLTIKGKQYPLPRYFKKLIDRNLASLKLKDKLAKKRRKIAQEKTNLKRSLNDNYKADKIAFNKLKEEELKRKEEKKRRGLFL